MSPPPPEAAGRGVVSLPGDARTLTDVLDFHAARTPDRLHIQLYDEDCENGGPGAILTFSQLRDGARQVAAGLRPGEVAALMLPTGIDYFLAFFGILYAGGVPVPIYPPARISLISDHIRRHFGILANCRARALITIEETRSVATLLKGGVETICTVTTTAELRRAALMPSLPAIAAGDIAFIQYTSGSTGQPKGVVLTHANLLANVRTMGRALQASGDDVFVSWLPLYHDMGLIGAWFGSLYHAVELVIMSPLHFLVRPERWLFASQRFAATLTASPNFGFEVCLKRVSDEKLLGLDLSSLRVVCNGAEPVSPTTIERFIERFAAYGRALPGHQIRIVDPIGYELPERREGRLQFSGPSATAGYFRNPEQTAELMDGAWLNSDDRAYMADGEVFVTGRAKDMIIRAGRNIYPQELEDAVGDIEDVRKGNVAVFASADPESGTERLVVLAETRHSDERSRERITRAVEALAIDLTGQPPDDVALTRPNTVLKTSSGKVRRAASRELYENGLLGKKVAAPWLQVLRLSLLTAVPTLRRTAGAAAASAYAGYVWALAALLGVPAWLLIAIAPEPLR